MSHVSGIGLLLGQMYLLFLVLDSQSLPCFVPRLFLVGQTARSGLRDIFYSLH